MPTQKELTAEYGALREQKNRYNAEIEELKPTLETLNHIRYNFNILEHDELPEARTVQRSDWEER